MLGPRTGSGRSAPREAPIAALSAGTRLFEYEISGVIGQGGFGVVYAATDHTLGRTVAIKEYLPASMAERLDSGQVTLRSERHADAFEAGLSSFINEARLLAQFDHASLVKVFRFWEANGTAYMVMPLYQGLTLKQHLEQRGGEVSPAWLHALLPPLLDALEVLHRARVFHRDIAPDNIMILEDGRPLLLDFGAARQRIGEVTQAMTVIVKPGYAPIEQYAEDVSLKQGAWTDVYALCAVLYRVITGSVPPPSVSRLVNDNLRSLRTIAPPGYGPRFLEALDRGLSVRPEQRPQSVPELRELLTADKRPGPRSALQPGAPSGPRRRVVWAGAAAATLALGGALFFGLSPSNDSKDPPAHPPPPLSPDPPPPPRPPYSPARAIDEVIRDQAGGYGVTLATAQDRLAIERDPIRFQVHSAREGHVYIFVLDPDNQLYLVFPNGFDQDNRIAAGQTLELPRPKWQLMATPPTGRNTMLAIVSDTERDFRHTGIEPVGKFAQIRAEKAIQPYRDHSQKSPFLAGRPVCAADPCSVAYGAQVTSFQTIQP